MRWLHRENLLSFTFKVVLKLFPRHKINLNKSHMLAHDFPLRQHGARADCRRKEKIRKSDNLSSLCGLSVWYMSNVVLYTLTLLAFTQSADNLLNLRPVYYVIDIFITIIIWKHSCVSSFYLLVGRSQLSNITNMTSWSCWKNAKL